MDIPFQNVVWLRKNEAVPSIYDVSAQGFDRLSAYRQVELHTVLYPYSRQVSSQDIAFYPFEEYVRDVLSQQRSAYATMRSQYNELFGLLLGLAIALIFARFKPDELFSIESIVSVFGAYTIGKELWDDIGQALVRMTKDWPIRLQDGYYRYRLEKHTTLTGYSFLAKRRRYGRLVVLPERIDFIKQSNSQTLRLAFDMRETAVPVGEAMHIHSIHIDPEVLESFEEAGFLFGCKLSLNKRFLGITKSLELFQSIDGGTRGCLTADGTWVDGAVFYRRTFSLGRCKWYWKRGLIHDRAVVCCE